MIKSAIIAATAVFFSVSGALAESPRIWGSIGTQMSPSAAEAQMRYIGTPMFWNLQPVLGVSLARNGSGWVGAGAAYTWRPGQDSFFIRFSALAGVYKRGSGRDLGGPVQFRNALDIGLTAKNGMEYGIGVDHRSNAGLYKPNPGLNSVYLFASFPLN